MQGIDAALKKHGVTAFSDDHHIRDSTYYGLNAKASTRAVVSGFREAELSIVSACKRTSTAA